MEDKVYTDEEKQMIMEEFTSAIDESLELLQQQIESWKEIEEY